jgi:hypothetical protein
MFLSCLTARAHPASGEIERAHGSRWGESVDAADDWIAEHIAAADVCVTSNIPLASRCLKKGALVQIAGTSKGSLLRRADFKLQAPRSRLQGQLGLQRPVVPVGTVPCGCAAAARCQRS